MREEKKSDCGDDHAHQEEGVQLIENGELGVLLVGLHGLHGGRQSLEDPEVHDGVHTTGDEQERILPGGDVHTGGGDRVGDLRLHGKEGIPEIHGEEGEGEDHQLAGDVGDVGLRDTQSTINETETRLPGTHKNGQNTGEGASQHIEDGGDDNSRIRTSRVVDV